MFKFVILAALVATAIAGNVPVTPCAGWPEAVSFGIRQCSGTPCDIAVGQVIDLDIGIALTTPASRLPVSALVTSNGVTYPFPLPSGNACEAISGGCPLDAGLYIVSFPVQVGGVNAGDETTVRVEIRNQDQEQVACGTVTTTFS